MNWSFTYLWCDAVLGQRSGLLDMVVSTLISTLFIILVGWVVMAPLVIIPVWRLLRQSGRSPLLSLVLLIPYAGFLAVVMVLQRRAVD